MKRQLLAVLAALFLLVGLVGCSSDDSSSKPDDTEQDDTDTTAEEDEPDTTEDTEDEKSDAEAALEKIESNLGLSKKDPDDDPDTTEDEDDPDTTVDDEITSGLTDDEADCVVGALEDEPDLIDIVSDLDNADPEDQALVLQTFYACLEDDSKAILFESFAESFGFDISPEEADCMFTSLISDPATVAVLLSGDEPADEDMAFAVGVVFGCLSPETQQAVFTEAFASTGLPADQIDCLATAVSSDPDLLALILALGLDPTTEIDDTSAQALADLFLGCGVDPSAL